MDKFLWEKEKVEIISGEKAYGKVIIFILAREVLYISTSVRSVQHSKRWSKCHGQVFVGKRKNRNYFS